MDRNLNFSASENLESKFLFRCNDLFHQVVIYAYTFYMTFRLLVGLTFISLGFACKKQEKATGCSSNEPVLRTITNKKATVRVTATVEMPVYLVEEGTIDTRLIPCNLSMDFYREGLQVIISGITQSALPGYSSVCCVENINITSISK